MIRKRIIGFCLVIVAVVWFTAAKNEFESLNELKTGEKQVFVAQLANGEVKVAQYVHLSRFKIQDAEVKKVKDRVTDYHCILLPDPAIKESSHLVKFHSTWLKSDADIRRFEKELSVNVWVCSRSSGDVVAEERLSPSFTMVLIDTVLGLLSLGGGLALMFKRRELKTVQEPGVPQGRQYGQAAGAQPEPHPLPSAAAGTSAGAPKSAARYESLMANRNVSREKLRAFFMQFSPRTRGAISLVIGFIAFYTEVLGPLDHLRRDSSATVYLSMKVAGLAILLMEYGLFVLLTGIEVGDLKRSKNKTLAFIVFVIICAGSTWCFDSWLGTELAKLGLELHKI